MEGKNLYKGFVEVERGVTRIVDAREVPARMVVDKNARTINAKVLDQLCSELGNRRDQLPSALLLLLSQMLMHPCGGDGGGRAGHRQSGVGVNNGNSTANTTGSRLVKF